MKLGRLGVNQSVFQPNGLFKMRYSLVAVFIANSRDLIAYRNVARKTLSYFGEPDLESTFASL